MLAGNLQTGKLTASLQQRALKPRALCRKMVTCSASANGQRMYSACSHCWSSRKVDYRYYLIADRRATLEDKANLVNKVDCFIFDCDGECTSGKPIPK